MGTSGQGFLSLGDISHVQGYLGVGTVTASVSFSSSNFVYEDGNQPLLPAKREKRRNQQ